MSSGDLKVGIYDKVIADATLITLIVDRIFPDFADQKTPLPYIIYEMDDERGVPHMTGVAGLVMTGIQFTIWAATAESRSDVVKALRLLFDGKIRQTYTGVFVQVSRNTSNIDTKQPANDGSQNHDYGTFMDFDFWHNR